jgi:hypothetical protein
LNPKVRIELSAAPDNIEAEEKGNLWIGADPKMAIFVEYSRDPAGSSPSPVPEVPPEKHGNPQLAEIYLNSNRFPSGASAVAMFSAIEGINGGPA